MIARLRRYLAALRLQRIVDARRDSFELQQFRKNRAAQLQRRNKEENNG